MSATMLTLPIARNLSDTAPKRLPDFSRRPPPPRAPADPVKLTAVSPTGLYLRLDAINSHTVYQHRYTYLYIITIYSFHCSTNASCPAHIYDNMYGIIFDPLYMFCVYSHRTGHHQVVSLPLRFCQRFLPNSIFNF